MHQCLNHLCGPSPDLLQHVHPSLVLGSPESQSFFLQLASLMRAAIPPVAGICVSNPEVKSLVILCCFFWIGTARIQMSGHKCCLETSEALWSIDHPQACWNSSTTRNFHTSFSLTMLSEDSLSLRVTYWAQCQVQSRCIHLLIHFFSDVVLYHLPTYVITFS